MPKIRKSLPQEAFLDGLSFAGCLLAFPWTFGVIKFQDSDSQFALRKRAKMLLKGLVRCGKLVVLIIFGGTVNIIFAYN